MALRAWRSLGRTTEFIRDPWIVAGDERFELPDGSVEGFTWIKAKNWVLVAAITGEDEVVLERCFKPGSGRVALILPAGALETGEEPEAAARRELREETGYEADGWSRLGSFTMDPNYGVSRGHLFLARGARQVAEPDGHDLEEIEVVRLPLDRALGALRDGGIDTIGTATALALAVLELRR